jgi:hypothetical protein
MINLIIHDLRVPSWELAQRITEVICKDPDEREGLAFFLVRDHKKMKSLLERCPNAFEDYRASWDRKNNKNPWAN